MSKWNVRILMELEEEGGSEGSVPESSPDTLRILEALLFASDELLTAAKIKTILPNNPDARQIRKMIDSINVQLQKERHPFEIVRSVEAISSVLLLTTIPGSGRFSRRKQLKTLHSGSGVSGYHRLQTACQQGGNRGDQGCCFRWGDENFTGKSWLI